MKKTIVIVFLLFGSCLLTYGQTITPEQYVATYKEMAIREMKRMGVPAAITLAQGILESESGNSDLVKRSNNHFGIKCKSNWTAASVTHDDDANDECFRAYNNAEESYRDHSDFLRGKDRYAALFNLDPKDYKGWCRGLKNAGYATNPRYPDILISQIEKYDLQQYTLIAMGEIPDFDGLRHRPDDKVLPPEIVVNESVPKNGSTSQAKVTINKSRALWVPKGTSLLAIASENNISLEKLMSINDLDKEGILEKDQFIFLEKKQKQGNRDFYIAEEGETLYDIAQKNGMILQYLAGYNNISVYESIKKGDKLFLRLQLNAKETNHSGDSKELNKIKNSTLYHEVLAREGLYAISKKYNVTVSQLKEWNQLDNDQLQVGQRLIVSK